MAAQTPHSRKSVMASVKLDVATHTRVGVAASIAGMDKSAWMSKVIKDAVKGIVVIDRRKGESNPDIGDIGQDERVA